MSCPVIPSLSIHGIPDDVCDRDLDAFGNMAWQTFKMLVWPALSGKRGEWDTARPITDMNGPRVFETYKGDWETFRKDAVAPLPWREYSQKATVCPNADTMHPPLGENSLVLASLHKFGNIDLMDVPAESNLPSIRHLLVAQNGTPVRYLTGFGEMAFNAIVRNRLYEPIDLLASFEAPEARTTVAVGTITIKSAWIDMTGISDPASFYTRDAWVQKPDKDPAKAICELKRVGLVGLHIGHKTTVSPQWIWASFEHVRNVPPRGTPPVKRYTFHDGTTNSDGTVKAMPNQPPPEARLPMGQFAVPAPYNVERIRVIPTIVQRLNHDWREMLSKTTPPSVWSNYELVTVQWAGIPQTPEFSGLGRRVAGKSGDFIYGAFPAPPCRSVEPDSNLTSSVLETFLQPDTSCQDDLTCMSCHSRARSYDFIWSIPLAHKDPNNVFTPSKSRRSALATLHEILDRRAQSGSSSP